MKKKDMVNLLGQMVDHIKDFGKVASNTVVEYIQMLSKKRKESGTMDKEYLGFKKNFDINFKKNIQSLFFRILYLYSFDCQVSNTTNYLTFFFFYLTVLINISLFSKV